MIKKVLIAEDHQSVNLSVRKTLEDLGIDQADYVYYCDEAFERIQKGKQHNQPYDLLITDLSFEEDSRVQKIAGGTALISAARKIQPELKVLVFSADRKATTIETLFNKYEIDGYVCKGRNDAKDLVSAIDNITMHQRYFPRHLAQLVKQKNTHDFSDFDIRIISCLAEGMRQKDIPAYLQENQIRPSGLSSIEKRLNLMKEVLSFSTNEQLVAYCKDMGII
jgi:DNA-binding NarL/FixJ family response regulator